MEGSGQNTNALFLDRETDDLSSHAHRQLIGSIGLVLPVVLWLIAGWRPFGEHPWLPLSSVSAYYYSGAVSAFAGMLVALALFLFTYRGYANKYYRRDRIAASIAGIAAMLIAFFPTGAPADALKLSWWTPGTGAIHLISAAVLFGSFIFFSVFQFPISSAEKTKPLPWDKKLRNIIYISCGMAIALCMLWVIYASFRGTAIFWPEVLALEFFAVSWLVKGRAYTTVVTAGKRSLHYMRHPRKLVKEVQDALQTAPQSNA